MIHTLVFNLSTK